MEEIEVLRLLATLKLRREANERAFQERLKRNAQEDRIFNRRWLRNVRSDHLSED